MRHVWSVLCQDAVIDRDSNAVSIFKCMEGVAAKFAGSELPTAMPFECKLVTLWSRSDVSVPEKVPSRIRYVAPDGTSLQEIPHEVDLTEHARSRNFLFLQTLPYRSDGVYEFVIETRDDDEWQVVAKVPFQVSVDHEPRSSDQ